VVAPLGVIFLVGGTDCESPCFVARGSFGENLVLLRMCDDGAIGAVPSLDASHLESRIGLCQWWWLDGWWYRLCTVAEEVH
jgi:hypothetical protein